MKHVDVAVADAPLKAVRACIGGTIERRRGRPASLVTERFGRLRIHTVGSRTDVANSDSDQKALEERIDIRRDDAVDRILWLDSPSGLGVDRAVMIDVDSSNFDYTTHDPTAFGLGVTHLFSPWRFIRVPSNSVVERQWVDFSHTHDSYWRAGDFNVAATLWNKVRDSEPTTDLEALRTALFMEARADRHGGGEGEVTPSILSLVNRIREASGGIVRDDRPIQL